MTFTVFPTWRSNISDQYIELISEICEYITNEFPDMQIIYVAHPSIEQNVFFSIEQKLEKISKEIIVFHSNESDKFNIFFSSSKFLITDYSSIAYDFSYKENAVAIYYEPLANMEANYQIRREFYENNCGLIAKNLEEIGMIFKEKYDKQYLENQVKIYEEANDTKQSIKVIMYFNNVEYVKLMKVLKELNLENDPNIVLIDARDNKPSASNVK